MRQGRAGRKLSSTLARSLDLLFALAGVRFGSSLAALADRGRVSRRQIYRYLDALSAAGVQLSWRREAVRGGWERHVRLVAIRGYRLVPGVALAGSPPGGRPKGGEVD